MASIVYTILLLVSTMFLVRKRDESESYFLLKIIGYFILGSFAFHINDISIPLGFIVYLLFFRPKLHVQIKRSAAILGVLAFILVHWIIPFAIHEWESRPIIIEHELGSVYTMNFQEEYELVKNELSLEDYRLRLEDFEVDYQKDGRITDLSWQLLGQIDNSYYLYQIRYDLAKRSYKVTYSKLDTWLQYNRLIDANHFFKNLNVLDLKEITYAKGDHPYYVIQSRGERVNYAAHNQTHFMVTNGEIQVLTDDQLPVEAYIISTFAMKKTGEERDKQGNIMQESFEGTQSSDYLFDVNVGEE